MKYRILVTGSRDWRDFPAIAQAFADTLAGINDLYEGDLTVVHGDCPTGADAMAQAWADAMRVKTERHPAEWDRYGRAAGPKRNQKMVDLGADVVLAFRNPGSRGTQDCINRAQKAGLRVKIYEGEK